MRLASGELTFLPLALYSLLGCGMGRLFAQLLQPLQLARGSVFSKPFSLHRPGF